MPYPPGGRRPPLQYTQHPFIISRRGRPMWRPGERRADDCKFAFYLSRGPDFRKRTGDISPPGEVLSRDGKYPKIPGSSSSQSPLHSERPGVGIPRCAPLLVLSQPRPKVVVGFPGLRPYDFRTRSARLENGLNLFGAAMNLGPLRPPPAAARAGQIRWSFFPHIAPLVCLAFSALLGAFSLFRRARFLHRAMTRIKNAPSSVIAYGDATFPPVWGRL